MLLNEFERGKVISDELFELNAAELECVAGGPEVDNDPGHG